MNHSSSLKALTFYCGNILQPLLLHSLFPSYCFYCFNYFSQSNKSKFEKAGNLLKPYGKPTTKININKKFEGTT